MSEASRTELGLADSDKVFAYGAKAKVRAVQGYQSRLPLKKCEQIAKLSVCKRIHKTRWHE